MIFIKVIVIGGGASGLVAAIYASLNNDVTILEKNSKCGRKILVSGNGKCNYFNSDFTIKHFNTENDKLKKIIDKNNQDEILNFFDSIGIVPNIKNGYYYPMSNQSVSILESLIKEANIRGVNIITDTNVYDISYNNGYNIKTNNGIYKADSVIMSMGSHAYYNEKSIGYDILKKFNHTINPVLPGLVQLVSNNPLKSASGVRIDANLSLYENGNLISNSSGEVQLTDYGISGICVFQLSSKVSKGLYLNKKEIIHINFLPWIDNFISYMDKRNKKLKNRTISELFDGIMNYKLSNNLLDICNIKYNDKWDNLSDKNKSTLNKVVTDYEFNIIDTKGFKNAQTCCGGVSINEINPDTMESLKQDNLYITGELIDVDGHCGGYNLGFAWITGMLAGKDLNDKNKTNKS